jgi:co-chaperonin GroES (HSP10)
MKINFKPLNNYLSLDVLKKVEQEDEVLVPDHAQKEIRWARVKETGLGVPDMKGNLVPSELKKDDLVCVMAHGRELVRFDKIGINEEIYCASELDVMCIAKTDKENNLFLQPLGSLIQIKKITPPEEDEDILLPDAKVIPPSIGEVISVGIGWIDVNSNKIEFQVKPGDIVVFDPYRALVVDLTPLGVKEVRYLIMHGDIWGKVEKEDSSEAVTKEELK